MLRQVSPDLPDVVGHVWPNVARHVILCGPQELKWCIEISLRCFTACIDHKLHLSQCILIMLRQSDDIPPLESSVYTHQCLTQSSKFNCGWRRAWFEWQHSNAAGSVSVPHFQPFNPSWYRSRTRTLTKEQTLNNECLQTALCELEAILNARPITITSGDCKDPEPLTPNYLLLLKGKPILPPGLFDKQDCYSRRRWQQVQYLSDLFWKRWTWEYLPLMQERQKWNKVKNNLIPGDIVLIIRRDLSS